jgi:hypothetical protein
METRLFNYFGRELPNYLGYGVLDKSSVTVVNDVITADYILDCDNTIVHKLTWKNDDCEFESFFHGEFNRDSRYPDISRVVANDFNCRDLGSDPCFLFLARENSKKGNIYTDISKAKDKTATSYYPAGKLMIFSLPMPEKTGPIISFLEEIGNYDHIKFYQEKSVILLQSDQEKKVTLKPLVLLEFSVPVAYMVLAAQTFAEANVICPEKRYRMIVTESYRHETVLFQGFRDQDVNTHYGLYHKACPFDKAEELTKYFSNSIRNL